MADPQGGAAASAQTERDAYMQVFSDLFAEELLDIYETDSSVVAVRHLTSCIEAGVVVWGHPILVKNPMAE